MPRSSSTVNQSTSISNSVSLERLAQLIAIGSDSFPLDLPTNELSHLKLRVQRYRRQRLITLLAKLIAADIAATRQNPKEGYPQ